jgi:endonuclease G
LERKIGATLDFADLPPNEQALKAGRPVVRIVTLPGAGLVPQGFATGFLIAPDLMITNHHVFRTADEAQGVGAQFLYERTQAGIRQGLIFELQPKRFFVNDKRLDYAVVAVKVTAIDGAPLSQFKFLPLIAAKGKIRKGDPVNIIQHPDGNPKKYATVTTLCWTCVTTGSCSMKRTRSKAPADRRFLTRNGKPSDCTIAAFLELRTTCW